MAESKENTARLCVAKDKRQWAHTKVQESTFEHKKSENQR